MRRYTVSLVTSPDPNDLERSTERLRTLGLQLPSLLTTELPNELQRTLTSQDIQEFPTIICTKTQESLSLLLVPLSELQSWCMKEIN